MIMHVIPIDDLDTHEEESTCLCHPTIEITDNGDILVIHNAFDGRE